MDSTIEQIVAYMGIDMRVSFRTVPDRKLIVSNLKSVPCDTDNTLMKISSAGVANTVARAELAENWNVAAIPCGDSESRISSESCFGSSSLDGAISDFRLFVWDSLAITWAARMHQHFLYWPFRALNRLARLLHRQIKGPAMSYVNKEGHPKDAAVVSIKSTPKLWIRENLGFCILIGGLC